METTKAVRPVAHLIVGAFMSCTALVIPQAFMPNLLIGRLCNGENGCISVILLLGALQLAVGITGVVMAPILGWLSDSYGRKPVILLISAAAILPPVLLASVRTTAAVYIWLFFSLIANALKTGGFLPTLLASVADVVDENHRPTVNGLSTGSIFGGSILGITASMGLKTADQALWASVILQVFATIYLKAYMKETNPREALLPANEAQSEKAMKLLPTREVKRRSSMSFWETARLVWSSRRLMTIVVMDFLNAYAFTAMESFIVYYLIAAFNYGEKQIAVIYLLDSGGCVLGMTILYPVLSQFFGERVVLWLGLFSSAVQCLLYAQPWTPWLCYIAAGMEVFHSMTRPGIGTMTSRGVDREQQGKIQGFMAAVRSVSILVAPLTITPLAAASLGKNPPFGWAGFPWFVCACVMVLASSIAIGLPRLPPAGHSEVPDEPIEAPKVPVDDTTVPLLN